MVFLPCCPVNLNQLAVVDARSRPRPRLPLPPKAEPIPRRRDGELPRERAQLYFCAISKVGKAVASAAGLNMMNFVMETMTPQTAAPEVLRLKVPSALTE